MPASHARSRSNRHVLGMAGGLLFAAASAWAGLVIYPEYPDAIERDWAYEVHVTQGSETRSLPVYNHCEKSALTDRTRGGDVNRRFCEFAFSGEPVRVDIRVCEDVQSYKVFPAQLELETSFSNGVISVWLDAPHHFGIELNDYVKTILSVFVEEPEDPASIPSRNDPNVLYIDGWVDAPGPGGVYIVSNQCSEVYIAPGAVLNSRLWIKRPGAHVHGRGMILDPFSDIFRYDQMNNTTSGVLKVQAQNVVVEDLKLIDARTYNYMSFTNNATLRNVKAMASMMCSDGISCGGKNFVVEGAWLYVGDNALVVSGLSNEGRFSDITIGTSCKAIFPQGSNTDVYMENVNVFRADEGLVWNSYNTGTNQQKQKFFFKNLSAVDSTLFTCFFVGANMGTYVKPFGFENLAIPNSTGSANWHAIGRSGGKTIRIYDDAGKPWTTSNYVVSITNLWVNGAQSSGFAESEITNPTGVTVTVVNTLSTPPIPVVPNRHVVDWTCPWKRYIGDSLQRDVRFAFPGEGEQRLVESNMWANLLADRPATRSAWQRSPSWKAKLDATTFEDGARIYRVRDCEADSGMYNDITDAFLRRGNGTYRLSFDARVVDGPEIPLNTTLLSNEDRLTSSFTVPNDGEWHRFSTLVTTGFDLGITELVGLHIKSAVAVAEIDFKNLSFQKVSTEIDPSAYECSCEVSFPGYAGTTTLEDIPTLVRISFARCGFRYDKCKVAGGGDLRFADGNGNLLASEIDTWDENGESLVWVKVPFLDRNTVITAYYGCEQPPPVEPRDVWSNGYVGVWHLNESALPLKDSSGVSVDFTSSSGSGIGYAAQGAIGGAVNFGASGNRRMLTAPDHDALDGFERCTFEAWTFVTNRPTGSDKNTGLLSKRNTSTSGVSYYLFDNGSATAFYISTNGTKTTWLSSSVQPDTGAWTHQAYTFDGTIASGNIGGWKNGVRVATTATSVKKINAGAADLHLGNFNANDARNFPGRIDEVRISNVARSADWIRATHDMVADDAFAAYAEPGGSPACEFTYGIDITFPGCASIGATLADFPVLVRLSTAIPDFRYSDFSRPRGNDLRFYDTAGNLIPHEIDTWDETGESLVWVRVPSLNANTRVTARYGCVGEPPAVAAKDVWDDGYVGVWHLGESGLPMKESSRTTTDFSSSEGTGIIFAAQGMVGGSVDFGATGNSRVLIANDHSKLDGFTQCTLEAWTYVDSRYRSSTYPSRGLLSKRTNANNDISYHLYDTSQKTSFVVSTNGTNGIQAPYAMNVQPTLNDWTYQAYQFEDGLVSGYKDGSLVGSATINASKLYSGATPLFLGGFNRNDARNYPGRIDEVRISNVARSAAWMKATYETIANRSFASCSSVILLGDRNPILTINVPADETVALNTSDVEEWITTIVKTGPGTLTASALPAFAGNFEIMEGVFDIGVKNGAGADGASNTIYVGDGASLLFSGTEKNILSGRHVIFEGAPAQGTEGKFLFAGGWVTIGANISIELRDDATFAVTGSNRMIFSNADIDLGGRTLTLAGSGKQASFDGSTFRNGGHIVVGNRVTFMHESGTMTFEPPAAGETPSVTLLASATINLKSAISSGGWTLYATNGSATVTSNTTKWPRDANSYGWSGPMVLGGNENLATYGGGYGVSNTVFNINGDISGSGALTVGPGWLNLRTANNTYSGVVVVRGENLTSTHPILSGGGGIGLWNGAPCFPNASSVTFNNSARLEFMDATVCTVSSNVVFAAGEGDVQSVTGGSIANRPTMAGFTKTGAGTLVFNSPVAVTGTGDVGAGMLKVANLAAMGATIDAMVAPQPVFSTLAFASGTALDLSGNTAFKVASLIGSPVVTNAGVFAVTGRWTLGTPGDVLTVSGENVILNGNDVSGLLAFTVGATFDLADESAFRIAVEAAGDDGLVVARAGEILGEANLLGMQFALPTPAAGLSGRWSMAAGDGGTTLRLKLSPASGYAAWVAENEITGGPGDKTGEIENAVRYAFDIAPQTAEIGDPPILQVVMDGNGNPAVQSRNLAEGRDDVTFGILATENLTDWGDTALVPMEKSATDGLWRPAASETPGYVYPAQMFFRYLIDIHSVP